MASPIAEAFVRLRPDLTGFRAELQNQLNREVAAVRAPPVRITSQVIADRPNVQQLDAAVRRGIVAQEQAANASRALAQVRRVESGAVDQNTAATVRNVRAKQEQAVADTVAGRAAEQHSRQLQQASRGAAGGVLQLAGLRVATLAASGSFLAGSAALLAFGKSLTAFADFEETINVFAASTGATADQMERVSATAEELGADLTLPAVSAGDAAEAMAQLARAGLSVEDSIDGSRAVLQLSTAAQIDFSAATEITANALNSFGLAGEDAATVADTFANAANASQGSILDVGIAMQQVSAVASQVGVSFKDTTSLLTLLAQAGLRGSDAGTSLRVALIRLAAPTDQARQALNALGLEIRDAQGNIRPEVFAEFGEATRDLAADTRDALASEIFGLDAIRAASILGRAGAEGLREAQAEMGQTGTVAEIARARTEGLSGQLDGLKSSAETAAIALGEQMAPAAESVIGFLQDMITVSTQTAGALGAVADSVEGFVDDLNELSGGGGVDSFIGGFIDDVTGLDANPISLLADQIEKIKGMLSDDNVFADIGFGITDTFNQIVTDIQSGMNSAQDAVASGEVVPLLEAQLRDAAAAFTGVGEIAKVEVPADIQDMIQRLADQGPEGRRVLRALGQELSEGLEEGITNNSGAVAAARQSVREAAAAAADETRDAIRDARGNLQSLGDTLSRQVGEIISEASPAAQRLDELTAALERLQNQGERRNVRFELGQAQQELEDMRATLAEIGSPNAAQQAAIDRTLSPLLENVREAEDAVKEVDLSNQIDQQEKLRDAAAESAEEGVAKIVAEFDAGKLSAAQFSQRITGLVAPALEALPKANLGFRFTEDFRHNLDTILEQARDLAGFLGAAGTDPGAQSVNVAARAREAQGRVVSAQANLQKQLDKTTETATNTREANRLLRLINIKLGQAPPVRGGRRVGTRDPNTSGPDLPQQNMAGKIK